MPTSHRRIRQTRYPSVGEEITTPPIDKNSSVGERIPVRTERAATVARWFGLTRSEWNPSAPEPTRISTIPLPAPGEILLLAGPSGSGKSRLLGAMRERASADGSIDWIDLAALNPPPATPLVDCFGEGTPLREALLLLARVGLGEAWSYLRASEELSEGQRFRLKLAMALHRLSVLPAERQATGQRAILICDEFAAVLDRITALVVARCLRRSIDAHPDLSAIVATSHDDLQPALRPERIAWCDFGRVEMQVCRRSW